MKVGIRKNVVAIIYVDEEDFYRVKNEILLLAEDFLCNDDIRSVADNTDIITFPSASEALGFAAEVSGRYTIKQFIHDE